MNRTFRKFISKQNSKSHRNFGSGKKMCRIARYCMTRRRAPLSRRLRPWVAGGRTQSGRQCCVMWRWDTARFITNHDWGGGIWARRHLTTRTHLFFFFSFDSPPRRRLTKFRCRNVVYGRFNSCCVTVEMGRLND